MKPLQLFINIIVIAFFTAIVLLVIMDKSHASQEWTESTFILNAKIVKMGVNNYLAPQIIN